jgi:hypothetical protein
MEIEVEKGKKAGGTSSRSSPRALPKAGSRDPKGLDGRPVPCRCVVFSFLLPSPVGIQFVVIYYFGWGNYDGMFCLVILGGCVTVSPPANILVDRLYCGL